MMMVVIAIELYGILLGSSVDIYTSWAVQIVSLAEAKSQLTYPMSDALRFSSNSW
jgi:hypothetical protein